MVQYGKVLEQIVRISTITITFPGNKNFKARKEGSSAQFVLSGGWEALTPLPLLVEPNLGGGKMLVVYVQCLTGDQTFLDGSHPSPPTAFLKN